MNMKAIRLAGLLIVVTISTLFAMMTGAQPANFPDFTVTTCNRNAVAPGSIFLSITDAGTNAAISAALNPMIDGFHLNSVFMDADDNLLVSNFGMDIWKINRQAGQIMWRLGGQANQLSFAGMNPPAGFDGVLRPCGDAAG